MKSNDMNRALRFGRQATHRFTTLKIAWAAVIPLLIVSTTLAQTADVGGTPSIALPQGGKCACCQEGCRRADPDRICDGCNDPGNFQNPDRRNGNGDGNSETNSRSMNGSGETKAKIKTGGGSGNAKGLSINFPLPWGPLQVNMEEGHFQFGTDIEIESKGRGSGGSSSSSGSSSTSPVGPPTASPPSGNKPTPGSTTKNPPVRKGGVVKAADILGTAG